VSHYDPISRASFPYRREAAANGDPHMRGAVWAVKNFKAGRSFRVSFALPFKQHRDPLGSNFSVEVVDANFVAGAFPHCPCPDHMLVDVTYDVAFVRHAA
jgi:hypothetical protein